MWVFVTARDASQLPSSEMERLPHFLVIIFSFTVVSGHDCAKVAIVVVCLVAAAVDVVATIEGGVDGDIMLDIVA